MKGPKVRVKLVGDASRLTVGLATALGFGSTIDTSTFDDLRSEAFSVQDDVNAFAELYLKSEIFSKYLCEGAHDKGSRYDAAMAEFWRCEFLTEHTNQRLWAWDHGAFIPDHLHTALCRARCLMAKVLGPFDLNELPQSCDWGPGATTQRNRRDATASNKWRDSLHVTPKARPYAEAFLQWIGLERLLVDVPGNKVTTVPKDWKRDRTIAIEPDWNAFLQKGIGKMIRRRLQKVGMLTPDAQYRNRRAARQGSIDGTIATLDLKSASNLVSCELWRALSPPGWRDVVLDLRSEYYVAEPAMMAGIPCEGIKWKLRGDAGVVLPYSMLSSMGNGDTFEVETLLFYALTVAASQQKNIRYVRAYGDDIICHTDDVPAVTELLAFCGFKLNAKKSFSSGSFRESCGGHYFAGEEVTPFYVKSQPWLRSQVIETANKALAWSCCRAIGTGSRNSNLFQEAWVKVFRDTERSLRGPFGVPGTLWTDWDVALPWYHRPSQSYRVRALKKAVDKVDSSEDPMAIHGWLWEGRGINADTYARPLEIGEFLSHLSTEMRPSVQRHAGDRDTCVTQWVPSNRWAISPVTWL